MDCGMNQHCVAGHCTAACTNDMQCPTGDYCNQGACVPDTRPHGNCTMQSDCMSTQLCIDGLCRYKCTTDMQCQQIDAFIPACGVDGVCHTVAEAHPQCTSKQDCAPTQDCVGNVCM
jgi:hypothetical protein